MVKVGNGVWKLEEISAEQFLINLECAEAPRISVVNFAGRVVRTDPAAGAPVEIRPKTLPR